MLGYSPTTLLAKKKIKIMLKINMVTLLEKHKSFKLKLIIAHVTK